MEFCVNLYANRFADSRPTSDPVSTKPSEFEFHTEIICWSTYYIAFNNFNCTRKPSSKMIHGSHLRHGGHFGKKMENNEGLPHQLFLKSLDLFIFLFIYFFLLGLSK